MFVPFGVRVFMTSICFVTLLVFSCHSHYSTHSHLRFSSGELYVWTHWTHIKYVCPLMMTIDRWLAWCICWLDQTA